MKKVWYVLMILFVVAACSQEEQEQNESVERKEEAPASGRVAPEVIADHLSVPWSITKKGSQFYISERNGAIVFVDPESGEYSRLPVRTTKDIFTGGEAGFLGLELIPNTDLEAFAYHTYEENGAIFNRLIRLKKEADGWMETHSILEGIPGAHIHDGGRIKIGPDEKVFVTTGDASAPDLAQDVNSLAGKILRVEMDGTIPSDNPFPNSPVYSYGHRNPQGITWDDNGNMYASEHGSSAHDELNQIEPGKNYGWPVIQGDEQQAGMETPMFHTGEKTWAPGGIAYSNGRLYIAGLRGQAVFQYDLSSGNADIFQTGQGRTRDIFIEKNDLFFITNNTDGRGTPAANDDKLLHLELNGAPD